MAKIYLASPFFDAEQVTRIEKIEQALTQNPTVTSYFSPRKYKLQGDYQEFTKPWAQAIYRVDMEHLMAADAVLAIVDFVDDQVDSGTAYEIGAAVQMKKPVIVFQEKTATVNLMISESLQAYLKDPAAVAGYDFEKLPRSEYEGPRI
ncbi:nucleoside 2-deoxyribosyltransferase [Fructilactobacillus florum]|uniref:Nucleoside 2-deoxyribosyltransferase n=1 Tax=Fructilactobacillus florum DSM 22689 = JCM 16035 TaxID=1423745 RepID=A0A0R2CKM9_9LACO|nr:nucleoside 2-deoxyribosyltransferase [Fructilactobacillus florum]KRM90516.1 hypothetical protein FC87_GL001201 [Fructilactobacillus florum DSM 22689 = JCM 16035]